jgi:hypothetical protein
MKLVEILVKELSEWPEDARYSIQDSDGEIKFGFGPDPVLDGGRKVWIRDNPSEEVYMDAPIAIDRSSAIVTLGQWQAERDRQNGGEWKRHRGNSQPVDEGTWVEVKLRCGDIQQGLANAFLWRHADCDVAANIMKYRIISQPQAEEAEKEVFVGKDVKLEYAFSEEGVSMEDLDWKPIGGKLTSVEGVDPALFGEVEDVQLRDTLSTYKEFTVTGQWLQIDGPIKWRDTVNELDAYIEKFTRERDALIERLASEGFALIPPVVSVVSEFSGVDMSDWRNWKRGDVIEMIADDWCDLSRDERYTIISTNDNSFTIIDDCDDKRELSVDEETVFSCGRIPDFKFIKRG